MQYSNFRILRAAIALIAILFSPAIVNAASDKVTWKLAHQWPTVHYYHEAAVEFARNVEERSDGALHIDIFPAGQLYGMREIPEALINGALELGLAADVGYSGYVPVISVFDLPMLVQDGSAMFTLLHGEFGKELDGALAKKGMTRLAWIDYGPMNFMTGDKQITSPDDLAGIKITVPGGFYGDAVAALGGIPVTTPPAQHYVSLQRGIVDGILVGPTSMQARKLYEAQNFLTTINLAWPIHILTASERALASLPEDVAQIVREEAAAMEKNIHERTADQTRKAVSAMADEGITVHEIPDRNLSQWRDMMGPVYDKFIAKTGDQGNNLLNLAGSDG